MGSVFLAEMGGSGRRGGEGWPVCGPGWLTGPRVVSVVSGLMARVCIGLPLFFLAGRWWC